MICRIADRQRRSLAEVEAMTIDELATWAAYYGSEHDRRAAAETRMAEWMGTVCWSIFRAAGHAVELSAFVPTAKPRQIPADSREAERSVMAWVVTHGGHVVQERDDGV